MPLSSRPDAHATSKFSEKIPCIYHALTLLEELQVLCSLLSKDSCKLVVNYKSRLAGHNWR